MAPVQNGRLIFNEIPTGYPEPGKTTVYDSSTTIDLDTVPLNGNVLIKTLVLSVDPYMRGKMRDPKEWSYSPAYTLKEPIAGLGIGKVLRSENPNFKPGDHVYGRLNYEEYYVATDLTAFRVFTKTEPNLPWSVYVGAAGMPGQTAYYAWKEYSKAKKGETVFVSTGAGPVGSMVIQLAKLDGLKVIASAGSDEKVEFCKEVGADVAFNYKTTSTEEILSKEGPIDVYWDNVGGSQLDAALGNSAPYGRVIVCGMIAEYNAKGGVHMHNLRHILMKRLSVNGFLVSDLAPRWQKEFFETVPKLLASGQLKFREDITRGLEKSGEALLDVLTGETTGKKVIVVADD